MSRQATGMTYCLMYYCMPLSHLKASSERQTLQLKGSPKALFVFPVLGKQGEKGIIFMTRLDNVNGKFHGSGI